MASYLFIALAIAIAGFILFRSLCLRSRTASSRAALAVVAVVLATPAVLFSGNYLLHMPDGTRFIVCRSLPGIEASSGLVGALLGVLFASARLRPRRLRTPVLTISAAVAAALLFAPFAKQILYKQDYSTLENRWSDGVCQQTSPSTCVPAACATVIRTLGGSVTERELASEAGTNRRGTEIWYMMRAVHRHGYEIEVHVARSLRDVPAPCILGVRVGSAGHVVVLMSKTGAGPEIGDPLGTRRRYTWKAFERTYRPELEYFVVRPEAGGL